MRNTCDIQLHIAFLLIPFSLYNREYSRPSAGLRRAERLPCVCVHIFWVPMAAKQTPILGIDLLLDRIPVAEISMQCNMMHIHAKDPIG